MPRLGRSRRHLHLSQRRERTAQSKHPQPKEGRPAKLQAKVQRGSLPEDRPEPQKTWLGDLQKLSRTEIPTARHTTHPPVPCLGRTFWISNVANPKRGGFPGGLAADFGTASPCGGRLYGRPAIARWRLVDFVPRPIQAALSLDSRRRGNARRRPHRVRAASFAGGRCLCLRALAASGLSSDCPRRAAGGAALPPLAHTSGRVGAVDCRGNMRGKSAFADAITASDRSLPGRPSSAPR